jgi:hypothetical protein
MVSVKWEGKKTGEMWVWRFWLLGLPKMDLLSLNRCRLHLKVFFLSDITNIYGTMATDDAWMGTYQEISWHTS